MNCDTWTNAIRPNTAASGLNPPTVIVENKGVESRMVSIESLKIAEFPYR